MTLQSPYELFVLSDKKRSELLSESLVFRGSMKQYYIIGEYIYEKQRRINETAWRFGKIEEQSSVYNAFLNESGYPF